MKTIVVFTDYSNQSEHAARYAIHLATKIKANILVADAFKAHEPELTLHTLGNNSFAGSEDLANDRLIKFCTLLEKELIDSLLPGKFSPAIYCQPEQMPLKHTAEYFEENLDIAFMVLGVNFYYGTSTIIVGETCGELLACVNCPLILVPDEAPVRYTEKYAFVADVDKNNVPVLTKIAQLAEYSAAELMLVTINNGRPLGQDQEHALKLIMKESISKIPYGRAYYRNLPNNVLKSDMEWLMQDNRFEALALVYQRQDLISPLLEFGLTSKIIGNIKTPILIYPEAV